MELDHFFMRGIVPLIVNHASITTSQIYSSQKQAQCAKIADSFLHFLTHLELVGVYKLQKYASYDLVMLDVSYYKLL